MYRPYNQHAYSMGPTVKERHSACAKLDVTLTDSNCCVTCAAGGKDSSSDRRTWYGQSQGGFCGRVPGTGTTGNDHIHRMTTLSVYTY